MRRDAKRITSELLMHHIANLIAKTVNRFIDELKFTAFAAVPFTPLSHVVPELDVEVLFLFAVWDHICLAKASVIWGVHLKFETYANHISDVAGSVTDHVEAVTLTAKVALRQGFQCTSNHSDEQFAQLFGSPLCTYLVETDHTCTLSMSV